MAERESQYDEVRYYARCWAEGTLRQAERIEPRMPRQTRPAMHMTGSKTGARPGTR